MSILFVVVLSVRICLMSADVFNSGVILLVVCMVIGWLLEVLLSVMFTVAVVVNDVFAFVSLNLLLSFALR